MTDSRYLEFPPKHPATPLPYGAAVIYVQDWLRENMLSQEERDMGKQVSIVDYADGDGAKLSTRPYAGVRVAEVDFFIPKRGGGTYMQGEVPWGLAVCAQVERCILALVEGWNRDAHIPSEGEPWYETDDCFWRLGELFRQMREDVA